MFPCKILFAVTFLDLHAVLSPTLSSLTKGCLYFKKYKIFTYSSDCLVHIQTTSSTTFLDPHTAEAQSQLKFPRGQRLVSLLLQHIPSSHKTSQATGINSIQPKERMNNSTNLSVYQAIRKTLSKVMGPCLFIYSTNSYFESLFGLLGHTSKQNSPCLCGADILAGKAGNEQMMYMSGDEHCNREKQVRVRGMGSFPR